MILKILISIFCGLAGIVSVGFLVGGLVKKNTRMWAGSLVIMFLAVLVPSYFFLTGVSDTVDYASSGEFQKDTRESARKLGSAVGGTASGLGDGLAESLDEETFHKLASKGGAIVGRSVEGAAAGLDGTVGTTSVFTSKDVEKFGIKLGRSDQSIVGKGVVRIFASFSKPFHGTLSLIAYDSQGNETDISVVTVEATAGERQHLAFEFQKHDPGLSGYSVLNASLIKQ